MKRVLSAWLMVVMIIAMCCTSAFATEETSFSVEEFLEDKVSSVTNNEISFTDQWINKYFTTDQNKAQPLEKGGATYSVSYNNEVLVIYITKGKTDEGFIKEAQRSENNKELINDVSNITDGLNIGADTNGATALLSGFSPLISLIIGVIAVLTTMGMTMYSAFDIAYIAFPIIRLSFEDQLMEGKGYNVKKTANGQPKMRFVTDDAQYAVRQGTIENGKSPWAIYFRKRIMSYIMLAIMLFILLTGNISLITNIALKVVSGIMNVLSGLA